MSSLFQIGDTVYLKSGSPKMTVKNYLPVFDPKTLKQSVGNKVTCIWFEGTILKESVFPQELLTKD